VEFLSRSLASNAKEQVRTLPQSDMTSKIFKTRRKPVIVVRFSSFLNKYDFKPLSWIARLEEPSLLTRPISVCVEFLSRSSVSNAKEQVRPSALPDTTSKTFRTRRKPTIVFQLSSFLNKYDFKPLSWIVRIEDITFWKSGGRNCFALLYCRFCRAERDAVIPC